MASIIGKLRERWRRLPLIVKVIGCLIIITVSLLFGFGDWIPPPVIYPEIPPLGAITNVYNSTASDGFIWNMSSTYGGARNASVGTVGDTGWKSPTNHNDPSSVWFSETNAYDDDTATSASSSVPAGSWGGFLELTISSITSDKLRYYIDTGTSSQITSIDVDVYTSTWVNVYQGSFTEGEWIEKTFTEASITKMRYRFYNSHASFPQSVYLAEADFWKIDDGNTFKVGQRNSTPPNEIWVWRGFVFFDTNDIGAESNITDAKLSIYISSNNTDTDFNVTIQDGQPGYPNDPLQSGDYDLTHYSGDGGQLSTSGISAGQYYNITLTQFGWVNKTGTTKFALRSDRDINYESPNANTDEYLTLGGNESGNPAKLYVTYEIPLPAAKYLWVQTFDDTESSSWILSGAEPYLNNDTSNYIASNAATNASWFWFQNTTETSAPQRIYLEIEGRANTRKGDEVTFYLWNGTSEIDIGTYNLTVTKFRWLKINVTDTLNTLEIINNTRLKVESMYAGTQYIKIRRAYLRLFYGAVPIDQSPYWAKASSQTTIGVKWTDPDGLSTYAFNHNASGSWLASNITGSLSGTTVWSNVTITFPSSTLKVVAYKFWTNDTLDNWETSFVQYVVVVWKKFNSQKFVRYSEGSYQAFIAPEGRKEGYANGLYWKFYYEISNDTFVYVYSSDGVNWNSGGGSFATGLEGYGLYLTFESRDGTDYVHYVASNLTNNPVTSLRYRRGVLLSNGSINWSTEEQIVWTAGGVGERPINYGVRVDVDGYPYVTWEQENTSATPPRIEWVSKSKFNNGTWEDDTGYPLQFWNTTSVNTVTSMLFRISDYDMYIVFAVNNEVLRGRVLNGTTGELGSVENVSTSNLANMQFWSGVADVNGSIHVTYRTTTTFYYSWRNVTSGQWDVKEEFVTDFINSGVGFGAKTYGVTSWNEDEDELVFSWWTEDELGASAWMKIRNSTAWNNRTRTVFLGKDYFLSGESTTGAEYSFEQNIIYDLTGTDINTGQGWLWAYLFNYKSTTPLSTGWNNITVWSDDIGHTLGEVNASIWSDGIEFTIISKYNGTYYTFIRGYNWNADIEILAVDDILYIWVTVAGEWSHTYP